MLIFYARLLSLLQLNMTTRLFLSRINTAALSRYLGELSMLRFLTFMALLIHVTFAIHAVAIYANEPWGDVMPESVLRGSHSQNLYHFEHLSWFSVGADHGRVSQIGYCVSIPATADLNQRFHWKRVNIRGYPSKSARRLTNVVPVEHSLLAEAHSIETNLWYGARPDLLRVPAYSLSQADDPQPATAAFEVDGYENEEPILFGSLVSPARIVPLQSRAELSVPIRRSAIDNVDDLSHLADVHLEFVSDVFHMDSEPNDRAYVYTYRWKNVAPITGDPDSQEGPSTVARVRLPRAIGNLYEQQHRKRASTVMHGKVLASGANGAPCGIYIIAGPPAQAVGPLRMYFGLDDDATEVARLMVRVYLPDEAVELIEE
ncbi:MAG: hypothetical protein DWQ41_04915 [Planctomycetota bacterium]|nr:MAG: hypothetical protein DWQ41_04915 [Planctomycetota bacterium]